MLDEPLLEDTGLPSGEVLLLAAGVHVDLGSLAEISFDEGLLVILVLLLFLHVLVLVHLVGDVAGVLLDDTFLATTYQTAGFLCGVLKKSGKYLIN